MDELIKALTAKVGIDEAVAEKAVGSILEFLKREAPSDPFNALVAHIPGAEAAIAANEGGGQGLAIATAAIDAATARAPSRGHDLLMYRIGRFGPGEKWPADIEAPNTTTRSET